MIRLQLAALLACALLAVPAASPAQSLLERGPNLGGTWVGEGGVVHFHFMHRFEATEAPTRKVLNTPTFLLGVGLPADLMVGARYATNSGLVTGYPNEWEFFGRGNPLRQAAGAPLDLAVHAGYNQPARSADGEVTVARNAGPLRLMAAGRGFSDFRRRGEGAAAVAAGVSLRVHPYVALAGDVASLLGRDDGEDVAWSAGLQVRIPLSPHTLSLHLSNARTNTLQGASVGSARARWGFEFTIPFTVARYARAFAAATRGDESATPDPAGPAAGPVTDPDGALADTAVVTMDNRLTFIPDTLHIVVGQTVLWRNTSDVMHTVTADPARAFREGAVRLPEGAAAFDSGDMDPGDVFAHRFEIEGSYSYVCVPHELAGMVGVVIVAPRDR